MLAKEEIENLYLEYLVVNMAFLIGDLYAPAIGIRNHLPS